MHFLNNRFLRLVLVIAAIYVTLHIVDQKYHMLPVAPHIKQIAWTIFLVSGTILLYIYATPLFIKKALPPEPASLPGVQSQQIKVLEYGFNRIGDIDNAIISVRVGERDLEDPHPRIGMDLGIDVSLDVCCYDIAKMRAKKACRVDS